MVCKMRDKWPYNCWFNSSLFFFYLNSASPSLLRQRVPAVPLGTTRLWFVVLLWEYYTQADTVRALFCIFFFFGTYFLSSDGECPRLIRYAVVEMVMKPRHPTSIGNIFVIQPFQTYCSQRSSYFSNLDWCTHSIFCSKGTVNSTMKIFFKLTAKCRDVDPGLLRLFRLERQVDLPNQLQRASPHNHQTIIKLISLSRWLIWIDK